MKTSIPPNPAADKQRLEFEAARHEQWLRDPATQIQIRKLIARKEKLVDVVLENISNLGVSTELDAAIRNQLVEASTLRKLIKYVQENSL